MSIDIRVEATGKRVTVAITGINGLGGNPGYTREPHAPVNAIQAVFQEAAKLAKIERGDA